MRLYQCPACDCLPIRYKKPPAKTPACIRCGRLMQRKSRLGSGYKWGFALTSSVIAALFAPHVIDHFSNRFFKGATARRVAGSLLPAPAEDRMTASLDASELFDKLEDADMQWQPQEELLPDGSTRYLYKRRAGEPNLSLTELRSLINDPPTFHTEREAIIDLLDTLRQAGVRVLLSPTVKRGAAAEWDHQLGVMRIQPNVTGKGSLDFLRVLNHEAIHVAQSCRGGSLHARPKILGLPVSPTNVINKTLADPIYANASHWERGLELEAYGLQNDIRKANILVSKECKVPRSALVS